MIPPPGMLMRRMRCLPRQRRDVLSICRGVRRCAPRPHRASCSRPPAEPVQSKIVDRARARASMAATTSRSCPAVIPTALSSRQHRFVLSTSVLHASFSAYWRHASRTLQLCVATRRRSPRLSPSRPPHNRAPRHSHVASARVFIVAIQSSVDTCRPPSPDPPGIANPRCRLPPVGHCPHRFEASQEGRASAEVSGRTCA